MARGRPETTRSWYWTLKPKELEVSGLSVPRALENRMNSVGPGGNGSRIPAVGSSQVPPVCGRCPWRVGRSFILPCMFKYEVGLLLFCPRDKQGYFTWDTYMSQVGQFFFFLRPCEETQRRGAAASPNSAPQGSFLRWDSQSCPKPVTPMGHLASCP